MQVLPRHLAGPGTVDPRTAWAFPYDEGWPFAQTDDGTDAAFSPCLRLQTTYDPQPDQRGQGTWTVSAHRAPFTPPAWRITFDAATPPSSCCTTSTPNCSTSTSKTGTATTTGC
ncbi:DUF317 domain-containing protein [Streptomyces sp900105755]|uniref:DUF317 domain-containing protein n=1 Tax=Streptomyces sp. 900105755 TaxID=3154389 RepID=A0ABV1TNY7_9ACTN